MPGRSDSGAPAPDVGGDLASRIDHTLLRPEATVGQIESLCEEAAHFGFASVCVNPAWVKHAATVLAGRVVVCTVVGFPLGANRTDVKVFETGRALADGAGEIDVVINLGAMRGGQVEAVREEIGEIVKVCRQAGALCKVILETGLLSRGEIISACRAAVKAGADFVKTSTGFGPGGATVEDVALMRKAVGPTRGVKASGGIRRASQVRAMLAAGASRIGTSSGVAIVQEEKDPESGGGGGKPCR